MDSIDPPVTPTAPAYADRSDRLRPMLWSIGTGAVVHLAVLLLIGIALVPWLAAPAFREVFADFDADVPALTRAVLDLPAVTVTIGAALIALGLVLGEFIIRSGPLRLVMALLVLLLALSGLSVAVLALAVPLIQLTVSGAGP